MANWVYNNVEVHGTKEQILEMLNYGLKQDGKEPISSPDEVPNVKLSMESYVPMPQTYRDAEFEFGKFEKSAETDGWAISFDFDTAWAVPLPFYTKISKLFPMLEYEVYYEEEDYAFVGTFKFKNGVTIEQK